MEKSKRFATLFLVVCLVLSMAVPAVWAGEDTGVLAYLFTGEKRGATEIMSSGTWSYGRKTTPNPVEPFAINTNYNNVWYLNQSAADNTVTQADGAKYPNSSWGENTHFTTSFNGEPAIENGDWVAFQIDGVTAGKYNVSITPRVANQGGKLEVYVLDKAVYTAAIAQSNTGVALSSNTLLDKDQNQKVYDYLRNNNGILNDVSNGQNLVDCSATSGAAKDIGNVTFENDADHDDYVLLFKISEKVGGYYLSLKSVTLTPVVNNTGVSTGDELKNALLAAESDSTIVLSNEITVDEALTIPTGVTLDLNGNTLTANVAGTGTVTDSSVGSTGKIVGQSAVQNVGSGELALYDGTTTWIVNYTLTPNGTASDSDYEVIEKDGAVSAVKFWYTFKFENAEAYTMIAEADENAGFGVGATLTFNGNPVPVTLQDGTVAGWAGEMAKDPNAGFAFYVAVTGIENLDESVTGNLDVKLTIEGSAGTAESAVVSYTIG